MQTAGAAAKASVITVLKSGYSQMHSTDDNTCIEEFWKLLTLTPNYATHRKKVKYKSDLL